MAAKNTLRLNPPPIEIDYSGAILSYTEIFLLLCDAASLIIIFSLPWSSCLHDI